jgi:hypothetical protein
MFLIAKMSEDSVDDVMVLNRGDDSYRSTAAIANLDVYIEHTFQSLSPGLCGMTLGG